MKEPPQDILRTVEKLMVWRDTPHLSGMIATALWAERDRRELDDLIKAYRHRLLPSASASAEAYPPAPFHHPAE
jgi:hypothetical protein